MIVGEDRGTGPLPFVPASVVDPPAPSETLMIRTAPCLVAFALASLVGCGDSGSSPAGDTGGGGTTDATGDTSGDGGDTSLDDGGATDVGRDARTDAGPGDTGPEDTGDDTTTPDAEGDATTGPRCGDGAVDATEVCDDGNTRSGDGCSASCQLDNGAVALVINEIVAAAEVGEDWIELANPNAFAVRADGWALTDDAGLPADDPDRPYVIASGTIVPAGGYLVFERDAEGSFGFGFASGGDGASLLTPRGVVSDETAWTDGQAPTGSSWGRQPDAVGDFATLIPPTRGAANR